LFEILTVRLGALYAMSACMTEEDMFEHDVWGNTLLIESRLTCPYNRNLAKMITLAMFDSFVVLLAETIPTTFSFDWSFKPACHRSIQQHPYNLIMYIHNVILII